MCIVHKARLIWNMFANVLRFIWWCRAGIFHSEQFVSIFFGVVHAQNEAAQICTPKKCINKENLKTAYFCCHHAGNQSVWDNAYAFFCVFWFGALKIFAPSKS